MDIVIEAGFDRFSGYGNDAVDLAMALERQGGNVFPLPFSVLPGLPRDFTDLLTKDPRGHKDVDLVFAPPQQCRAWELQHLTERRVFYSMWERLPLHPEDFRYPKWLDRYDNEQVYRPLMEGWDAAFVTCPMNVDAFKPMLPPDTPIYVVPCGIEPRDWPEAERDWHGPFRFLAVGTSAPRKNVWTLLEVWRELKREKPEFDASLTLHSLGPGFHPGLADAYGPDLTLSERPLARKGMVEMYQDHHVLVTVSRGEGNNKPAMEMMATGGTVIATDWSGHQNWLYPDAAYPLRGTLVTAGGAPWAWEYEVDREHLKETLWRAWESRTETLSKARVAAQVIRTSLTWDHVAQTFLRHLQRVVYG